MSTFSDRLLALRQRLAIFDMPKYNPEGQVQLPKNVLEADTQKFFDGFAAHVKADFVRYRMPVEEAQEQKTTPPTASDTVAQAAITVIENSHLEADTVTIAAPAVQEEELKKSPYIDYTESLFSVFTHQTVPAEFKPSEEQWQNMPPPMQNLYTVLANEVLEAQNDATENAPSVVVLQKLNKSLHALIQGKISDLIALMKSARRDDPKNRLIAFMLSQLYYFRVHQGQSKLIPEARAEAKNACAQDERVDPSKTLYYRYNTIAAERLISADRAADLMREYYLINPEGIEGAEGLAVHGGMHFKAWLVMATLPHKYWSEYEIESLNNMVTNAVGGVAFYLHSFRPIVLQALKDGRADFEVFNKTESLIQKSYSYYVGIAQVYSTQFDPTRGMPLQTPHSPWTILQYYVRELLTVGPFPKFGHVMLHTSLNGRRYASNAFPNDKLQQKGINILNYWRVWGITLTPLDDINANRFPLASAVAEASVLQEYQALLDDLREDEKGGIDAKKWDYVDDHLETYGINQLFDVGRQLNIQTSVDTKNSFSFLEIVRDQLIKGVSRQKFLSEVIQEAALTGSFMDLKNIQEVFEGSVLFLNDVNQKPKARLERALKAINDEDDVAQKNAFFSDHLQTFGWIYFIVLPLAVFTFLIIVFLA